MNNKSIRSLFLLFCILTINFYAEGQTNSQDPLLGKWILVGFKSIPYHNYPDNNPIIKVAEDMQTELEITEDLMIFSNKQIFYSVGDTMRYFYDIQSDSKGETILLEPEKKANYRRKAKKEFEPIEHKILSINHSSLTLEQTVYVPERTVFRSPTMRYYYTKQNAMSPFSEKDFYGEWYLQNDLKKFLEQDTIIISKNPPLLQKDDLRNLGTLEFIENKEKKDTFQYRWSSGNAVLQGIYIMDGNWTIDPYSNTLTLHTEEHLVKSYSIYFETDQVVFILN